MVGDPIRRGISGGQKKRLTTGTIEITSLAIFVECFEGMDRKMILNICFMRLQGR